MSVTEIEAPIAVRTIDLATEPVDVDLGLDPDGRRYNGLYALLTRDGLAAGAICVPAVAGVVTGDVLRAAIAEEEIAGAASAGRSPADTLDPLVSVVICAIDGGGSAVRTVETILAGSHANIEVIVVNNRPADGGLDPVDAAFAGDPRVRTTDEPRPGLSFARNAGAAVARGEIVAFTDDDSIPDSRWIERIVAAFAERPETACVTGLILPLSLDTDAQVLLERFAGFSKGFERRGWSMAENADDPLFPYRAGQFGSGANVALRAEALARIGGYDDALGIGTPANGGEDLDLFIRVLTGGMTLVYEPTAVIWHDHPRTIEHIEREVSLYGAGLGAAIFKQLWRGPHRDRLLRSAAGGVRYLLSPSSEKNARRGDDFPAAYSRAELRGVVRGPLGYLRSRRFVKRAGAGGGRRRGLLVSLVLAAGLFGGGDAAEASRIESPRVEISSAPASFEPVWVGELELSAPPDDLVPDPRDDGGRFTRASLLVRLDGEPVGYVKVLLREGRATAGELRATVDRELGDRIEELRRSADERAAGERFTGGCAAGERAAAQAPPTSPASVVICSRDRADSLGRTLRSAIALDYPDFEIVVVDNSPDTDGTHRAVEAAGSPLIRYVAEPVPGLSRARNRGLSVARGEIIAFTDDDVVVDPLWLKKLDDAFARNPSAGCVTGLVPTAEMRTRQQLIFDESVNWSHALNRRLFDLADHRGEGALYPFRSGRFGTGANFAVRRSAAESVGLFDEALGAGSPAGGGEDLDYFLRVIEDGWAIAVEPAAIAWHYHRADEQSLRRQFLTYGSGAFAYAAKYALQPLRTARIAIRSLGAAARPHERTAAVASAGGGAQRVDRGLKRAKWRGRLTGPWLYLRGRSEIRGRAAAGGLGGGLGGGHGGGHGDDGIRRA